MAALHCGYETDTCMHVMYSFFTTYNGYKWTEGMALVCWVLLTVFKVVGRVICCWTYHFVVRTSRVCLVMAAMQSMCVVLCLYYSVKMTSISANIFLSLPFVLLHDWIRNTRQSLVCWPEVVYAVLHLCCKLKKKQQQTKQIVSYCGFTVYFSACGEWSCLLRPRCRPRYITRARIMTVEGTWSTCLFWLDSTWCRWYSWWLLFVLSNFARRGRRFYFWWGGDVVDLSFVHISAYNNNMSGKPWLLLLASTREIDSCASHVKRGSGRSARCPRNRAADSAGHCALEDVNKVMNVHVYI